MYLAHVEGNQVSHFLQPKFQTDRHTMKDCPIKYNNVLLIWQQCSWNASGTHVGLLVLLTTFR